ncbi:MAG: DNA mismatch repair protein MutS, partial [Pseudomonadota bacterium]
MMQAPETKQDTPKDVASAADATRMTPMMAQYIEIKAANPGFLLFYRMGDFYELFFDDAVEASRALGITLTKRGKHAGDDIPMCGVPVHKAEDYLNRLIGLGYRIAVCDQTEDPAEAKKRGSGAVVKREVVRLVTPGTITEDGILDAGNHSYLAALSRDRINADAPWALAWADMSTGAFALASVDDLRLGAELARLQPRELVLPESLDGEPALSHRLDDLGVGRTTVPNAYFDSAGATARLCDYFGVATLDGFADFNRAEQAAAAAIVSYLDRTQVGRKAALAPPRREDAAGAMVIDGATSANLELVRTLRGETRGSLVSCIDRTVTAPGRRTLVGDITGPLMNVEHIIARLDAVDLLVSNARLRDAARDALRRMPDMARALARLSLERGGPRDLGAIQAGLAALEDLAETLGQHDLGQHDLGASTALGAIAATFANRDTDLATRLAEALADDLPLNRRDGGFVRAGHRSDLDEQRQLRDDSRRIIADLQARYANETGVKALKVRHNNVLGYFVEVTAQNAETLRTDPHDATFIHRQTMANAVRFTTGELADLESRIVAAADKALAIEDAVFIDLSALVVEAADGLRTQADAAARLDV